jgi:pyroglutamyl-peptidase
MARVLITGFEPFAGFPANASWDAVSLLADTWNGPHELVTRRIPVQFGSGGRRLTEHVVAHTPDVVVAVGVAPGRVGIQIERVAVNLRNAAIADNAGRQPIDVPVLASGPVGYFSTLPVTAIVAALGEAGIASSASLSAGSYVCNDAFYLLQNALAGLDVKSGFIHVPASPQMELGAEVPTMSNGEMARGLRIAIETTIAFEAAN